MRKDAKFIATSQTNSDYKIAFNSIECISKEFFKNDRLEFIIGDGAGSDDSNGSYIITINHADQKDLYCVVISDSKIGEKAITFYDKAEILAFITMYIATNKGCLFHIKVREYDTKDVWNHYIIFH